jgi:hypothetical protein
MIERSTGKKITIKKDESTGKYYTSMTEIQQGNNHTPTNNVMGSEKNGYNREPWSFE